MSQHPAGPSNLYAFHPSTHDTPISPPKQYAVPPTPNRECEAVPEQWFPIERGLSARGREKLPANVAASWCSEENASAHQGVKADLRGETRVEEERKKQEEERKARERKELSDLAGEVEKVVRKVYHLSEPGRDRDRENRERQEREDDASTTAVARSEQERELVAKAEESSQHQTNSHVSRQGDSCEFRKVAALSSSSYSPQTVEAKQEAIRAWITDVHAQTGGKPGLPVPSWAAKVGVAPTNTENSVEETLVGDWEFNYPTKLPDDENPEDEVDRISLTAEIPMGAYIKELTRRASVGVSQLKVAACYLIALNPTIQALMESKRKAATTIASGLPVEYTVSPLLCARRTLVSCLIIASKFLGDNVYTIKAWSRITGLEAPDLVQCEAAITVALGYRMWVGANVQNLKNDVFYRTLAQLKAPIPHPPPLVMPQAQMHPQPQPQDLRTVLPTVPAAHAEAERNPPAPKTGSLTRKRSRAVLNAGPSKDVEVRAQKRKAISRFSMPRTSSSGCATGMVMPEQVDEPRPMAEVY